MTDQGEVLETVRVANSVENVTEVLTRAGECPEVVLGGSATPTTPAHLVD